VRYLFTLVLLTAAAYFATSYFGRKVIKQGDLTIRLQTYQFPDVRPFAKAEMKLAEFGYELFRDTRLSANGEVACVSCHKPEHSFADNRALSEGLERGQLNTPAIINEFASHWFFWNGRVDSLVMQAQDPLESLSEQGISRFQVVRRLYESYRPLYRSIFGPLPEPLTTYLADPKWVAAEAAPAPVEVEVPDKWRSLWIDFHFGKPAQPAEWARRWQQLPATVQKQVNRVFGHATQALAQYQKGLIARDAPFDRFVAKAVSSGGVQQALSDEFNEQQLRGFLLFTGKANCTRCHSGPLFTDHDFHNNGVALSERRSMGRIEGLLRWAFAPGKCQGQPPVKWCTMTNPKEAALTEAENDETLLGIHKTPSLRQVDLTAPYMHDGSIATLDDVVAAYNEPYARGLGMLDPAIQPLNLSAKERRDLVAFLKSLSSPVEDLSTQ
jgi:cytochrome c peroxidase